MATPTPTTQQRVVVTSFNPADILSTLAVVEGPVPTPGAGELLIKVTMRPINPADIFSIMGVYPGFAPASLPATPGLEGCGTVVSCTSGSIAVGSRGVVFFDTKSGNGSWQEYVVVPESSFLPVPDTCPDSSAAQFFVNPISAYGMLDLLNIPSGGTETEYVLQSAAGSVLGRQFIAMAKLRGIKTINLVRRAEQAAELRELGADEVICTETEDVVARVKEITAGRGAYAAIDAVAGDLTAKITGSLRNGGTVLVYGAMSGLEFKGSVIDTLFRQVTISGFWLNVWLSSLTPARKAQVFADVSGWLAEGQVTPYAGAVFSLGDVVKAVQHSQLPARGGKVLLQ